MNKLGNSIKVIEVLSPDCSDIGGTLPPLTVGEQGKCAHCGKKITWRALCENERGEVFELGLTCAKADDSVHKLTLLSVEEKAQNRMMRAQVASAEFVAWASSKPHPKGWNNKTLLDDVQFWMTRKPAYTKATLVAFRRATGKNEDAPKVTKKDQDRLNYIQTALDKLESDIADHLALVAKQPELRAAKKETLLKLKTLFEAGDLTQDIYDRCTDDVYNALAPIVFEYDHNAARQCAIVAKALSHSGIEAPKYPSLAEVTARLGK